MIRDQQEPTVDERVQQCVEQHTDPEQFKLYRDGDLQLLGEEGGQREN